MDAVEIDHESDATESLQPEVTRSFESLGLVPGDWNALLPMPFLASVWSDQHLDVQERQQIRPVIDSILSWPATAKEPSGDEVEQARKEFYASLSWEGDATHVVAGKLQESMDLLAWFFAKHVNRSQRLDLFERYQSVANVHRVDRDCFSGVLDHLRNHVDVYLACRCFAQEPSEPELGYPDMAGEPRLSDLPWQAALIAPLAHLVADTQNGSNRLRAKMETEIADSIARQRGVLREFLGDADWKALFFHITDSPATSVHDRIETWLRYCSEALAAMPLRSREAAIAELQRIAGNLEIRFLSFSRTGLTTEQIENCFDSLAQRIEQVRLAFASAASQPDDVQTAPEHAGTEDPLPESMAIVEEDVVVAPEEIIRDSLTPPTVPSDLHSADDDVLIVREISGCPIVTWEDCLNLAGEFDNETISAVQNQSLLFDEHRVDGESVTIVPQEGKTPESLWFVGDIHCDLISMVNAWNYIETVSRSEGLVPHVVFLGDFIDRGTHGCETLAYLFRLIQKHPGQIAVLAGNHDEFQWNAEAERFEIGVDPAETIVQLNEHLLGNDSRSTAFVELGKYAAEFFASLPRALVLPDGTLLAHGGFPHADLLDSLHATSDLSKPDCLQDFVWSRAANVRRRRPDRHSRNSEYGRENFADFCEVATNRLGVPVARLIRGHDHVPKRFQMFDDWPYPVLTINTMGRQSGEFGVEQFPPFVVARHRTGRLPVVHRIKLDESEYIKAYSPAKSKGEIG